jgi:hypothetical protein
MKVYREVDVWTHVFLNSALLTGEWSVSRPGRFISGERDLGTHWLGGWGDTTAGLDDMEKREFLTPSGLELRPLGLQASS